MATTRRNRETDYVNTLEDSEGFTILNVDGEEIQIVSTDDIETTWTQRTSP